MAINVNQRSDISFYLKNRGKVQADKDLNLNKQLREEALNSEEITLSEDESAAAILQKFKESAQTMSSLLAQARSLRDAAKKSSSEFESSFERVLDEDVHHKAGLLLKAVSNAQGANIDNLLRHIRSFFPDDSDLVLVLREMLRQRDLDEVVKKRLQKLLAHVEAEADPKRLKAGINVALKARLFGKTLNMSPAIMRESYRDFLESDSHEMEIYQDWIANFGVEKRVIAVDFFESSLVSDIDSLDPSCSYTEFGYLLNRLGQIKYIRSCDLVFIQSLMSKNTILQINNQEKAWLLFMFSILQNSSLLGDYLKELTGDTFRFKKKRFQATFLQLVYRACKKLPDNLFFDEGNKEELEEEFEKYADQLYQNEQRERRRGG